MSITMRSPLALVAGILSGGLAVAMLVRDASLTGFRLEHAVLPGIVALTVVLAMLAHVAWAERSILMASVLAALAVIGIGITVTESTGRRADIGNTRQALVDRDLKNQGYWRDRVKVAQEALEIRRQAELSECRTGAKSRCRAEREALARAKADFEAAEAGLLAVKVAPHAHPDARQLGEIAGLLGYNGARVEKVWTVLAAPSVPLWLELVAALCFMAAFAPVRRETISEHGESIPDGGTSIHVVPASTKEAAVVSFASEFQRAHGRLPRHREVVEAGFAKATASRGLRRVA